MSIVSFSIYVTVYYIVHSILTTNYIKGLFRFKGYRIAYNLFAIISLLPIIMQLAYSYQEVAEIPLFVKVAGAVLIIVGVIIHIATFRWFSSAEFLGIKVRAEEEESIITDGIYATSRHPFYLGTLLMFWGLFMMFTNSYFLSFAGISTLYVLIGSRLEEDKLMVLHHQEYTEYRELVPMLLPWKKPKIFLKNLFRKE